MPELVHTMKDTIIINMMMIITGAIRVYGAAVIAYANSHILAKVFENLGE